MSSIEEFAPDDWDENDTTYYDGPSASLVAAELEVRINECSETLQSGSLEFTQLQVWRARKAALTEALGLVNVGDASELPSTSVASLRAKEEA